MDAALPASPVMADQDKTITEVLARERNRLGRFIRQRVPDPADAEDILQDVWSELVESFRLARPIEQVGAWLFQVARNRIIDRFRLKSARPLPIPNVADGNDDDAALDDLPAEQREVFIAHELEGKSFRELAAQTGLSVNTLLSRKRYAVLHLRAQLHQIYREFEDSETQSN
jgi:DNA-directed RNA polymerase specialized sigma24 family protein